ncbi:MAG: ABC transporter permease [Holophagaceae bacterium]|nr:ABC transporter permease [Holophagaceae bacterium]
MVIQLAKKEAMEHLKSFRFLMAFIFIIATFFLMMVTRHFEYKSKYDEYLLRLTSQEELLDKYANSATVIDIVDPILPPSSMEIIVDPATTVALTRSGLFTFMEGPGHSLDDNPIESINLKIDIIALVGILGSLLALLLSYDATNREVKGGTVKLLLSLGVPRIKIILGKILGGSLAVILPIVIIFLLTSTWLATVGGEDFGVSQWMSLFGIFLASILYIMFFYSLGAFVSSAVLDQTLSAFSCFGIWAMFVIVIPVLCPYVAKSVVKVPDQGAMRRQIFSIDIELGREHTKITDKWKAQGLSEDDAVKKANEEFAVVAETRHAKVKAMIEDYKNAVAWQTKLSVRLSCISPYSAYLVAVEELSGMGFEHSARLSSVANSWWERANEYLEHQFEIAREQNPVLNQNTLGLSGIPRFNYVEPTIGYKFSHALPYIMLLSAYYLLIPFLFVYALYSKRRLF